MLLIYLFLSCMMCNILYYTYGLKINWIFAFANTNEQQILANHKRMTRIQKFKRMINLHFHLNLSNIEKYIYLYFWNFNFLFISRGSKIFDLHMGGNG
jgi:hypothetical protein